MSTETDWNPDFAGISVPPPPWAAKRPVRIAILGDFSAGALTGRLETGDDLARRKPIRVEFDTLEDALTRLDLKLTLPVGAEGAAVEVPITELESFHPDELYRNVEVFSALSGLRKRLNTPATFAKAAAEVQAMGGGKRQRRASAVATRSKARGSAPSSGARLSDFARLTGRSSAREGADDSIDALLRNIVGPFVVKAPNPKKDELVANVDSALSDAMRALLHQPDFQNAESLWRGVDFLLRRLETGPNLQVWLIDVSAEEVAADLSSVADLADSGLYKLLVEQPSQDAGGGYAFLCGCFQFDASPVHMELLGRAARVAAHAGAPLITGITTDTFTNRKEPPHRLVKRAIDELKALPEASYLALMGPRFMLRHPYGKRSDPISSFAFEEFSLEAGLRGMLWAHPSLLAMCVLAVPGGQLTIGDLAFHHMTDAHGDSVALPCTDRLVNTQAAAMLRDHGINAVMAHKGEALVRISGLQAINDDGLALPAGALRKPPADSRMSVKSNIGKSDKAGEAVVSGWAPAARGGGGATTSKPAGAPAAAEAEPAAAAPAEDTSAADAELEALLASLSADEPAAPAPAAETAAEAAPEASADEAPAAEEAPAEAAAEEEAMDPELAELLKSLG